RPAAGGLVCSIENGERKNNRDPPWRRLERRRYVVKHRLPARRGRMEFVLLKFPRPRRQRRLADLARPARAARYGRRGAVFEKNETGGGRASGRLRSFVGRSGRDRRRVGHERDRRGGGRVSFFV